MKNEEIGKLIKEERLRKNMTQEELANILYVSNKTISKWETGRGIPSIDLLVPLSKTLDIELKELLTGSKDTSYEELLVKELKNKKRKNKIELIGGIIICLFLCLLETFLYITNVDEKVGVIIFALFIILLLLIDFLNYFIYKK